MIFEMLSIRFVNAFPVFRADVRAGTRPALVHGAFHRAGASLPWIHPANLWTGSMISLMLLVTGCASLPTGPGVMVLPGTGLTFEQFRNDDVVCRQFASWQVGGAAPDQVATSAGVGSAVAGTALGAAAGAALGGGEGAAIGAGTGLVAGSVVGAGAAEQSAYGAQQRYDIAYIQCMYAKGHRVPVSGRFSDERPRGLVSPPANIPAPPPGTPPPPPLK